MNKNSRLEALKVLIQLFQNQQSLNRIQANEHVSAMTKEICFGVCRFYYRLEAFALSLLKKKPKEPELWIVILMGLYQLHYMRQPEYAVVKETVQLLDSIKKSWAKGLVNAILRNFCHQQESLLSSLQDNPLFEQNHPQWFLKQLQQDWPHHWHAIITANDQRPPLTLRVNQLKISRPDYLNLLQENGIQAKAHELAPQGIVLDAPTEIKQLPGYQEGFFSVQDAAAQMSAALLELQPGQRVLDICCAPGGKTSHILETEPQLRQCVAVDIDKSRLERVRDNLSRLQLQATLIPGDATNPASWWDGKLFDRILLDAPCSATGVIRRHPDIKLLRTANEVEHVVSSQQKILSYAWELLRPGGLLVYVTCSVLHQENEQQIASFLSEHVNAKVVPQDGNYGLQGNYGRQIFPGEFNMDGFFYSVLRKE